MGKLLVVLLAFVLIFALAGVAWATADIGPPPLVFAEAAPGADLGIVTVVVVFWTAFAILGFGWLSESGRKVVRLIQQQGLDSGNTRPQGGSAGRDTGIRAGNANSQKSLVFSVS